MFVDPQLGLGLGLAPYIYVGIEHLNPIHNLIFNPTPNAYPIPGGFKLPGLGLGLVRVRVRDSQS